MINLPYLFDRCLQLSCVLNSTDQNLATSIVEVQIIEKEPERKHLFRCSQPRKNEAELVSVQLS
jgi:hypothetical protein